MSNETQPAAAFDEPVPDPARAATPRAGRRAYLRRGLSVLAFVLCLPLLLTLLYAAVPPPVTNLMLFRALGGAGIDKEWVSLEDISPHLPRAVISAEDARFCQHWGVDWREFQGVVEDALDKSEAPVRGASTIPMQAAKNLFLWDGRSAMRKMIELPLAMWMDLVWSKRRMIEIYLNIVEWAPGVYGAEAAARHHFGKSSKKLTKKEAALLAAVLPNPIRRNAGKPSRGVRNIASRIQLRMNGMAPYLACLEP